MAKGDKTKNSKLGYDPLAWLDGEAEEANATAENPVEESAEQQPLEQRAENTDAAQGENAEVADESPLPAMAGHFKLPGSIGIAQVADVKQSLEQLLMASAESLEVDAEEVQSIDTAGIQLLLSFVNAANDAGMQVNIVNCSEKLENVMALLDVRQVLIPD